MATSPSKSDEDSCVTTPSSNGGDDKDPSKVKQWLREEAREEFWTLAVGCVAMMVSSASNTLLPRFMGRLLDQNSAANSNTCDAQPSYFSPTLSLLMVVVGGGTASFLRTTMLNRAEESLATRLRGKVFQALMTKKSVEWFQTERIESDSSVTDASSSDESTAAKDVASGMTPGKIGTVLNDDVTDVAHAVTATAANLVRSSISCAFSTYNMLRLNPQLFITSLCTVPLIGAAAMTMRKFLKRLTAQRKDCAMRAAAFAEERITQVAMVKMSNREMDEVEEYKKLQEECKAIGRKESLANGAFMGFTFSATSSALFMVVHLGGRAVAAKRMTSGQLTSFATYSFLLGLAASGIVKSLGELYQSMVGAKRVYDIVRDVEEDQDQQQQPDEATKSTSEPVHVAAAVESISLRNLTFGYKARPDTQVLRNVSMELKRGSVVALVGKNGSGKSTISCLLAGLYKPHSGSITLLPDGANYEFLDRSVKRQLVQMVPQGAPLLNISILDNVKYSNPEATQEQVDKALKLANAEGFISKLPGGINFVVGMHGCKLSAGQRQRLALARALVSDPMLLILDEASAAMDNEGETAVADAVVACKGQEGSNTGRALLLITHRPKSLEVADVVVVLRDGQIVETGTLKDLKKDRTSALCALMPDLLKL